MPTTLERIQYGFDRDDRRLWRRRPLASVEDNLYGYDGLSQVINAARGELNSGGTAITGTPKLEESWDYDPTGNWQGFTVDEDGSEVLDQTRVHDRGNRLLEIEESPDAMVLDRAGRVRQMAPDVTGDWEGTLELTWDAWGRITKVKSNDVTVGEYGYDGLTRRTTRTVDAMTTHTYYSDTWRPLEERKDEETDASIHYLWGVRHRDDLVRRDRMTGEGPGFDETRYVMMDYFNAAAIADGAGNVTERYSFSAFGVRRILAPDFSSRSSSECAFEFGFHGQFLDTESGLYNYGFRYYSPWLGRWTCKDPIGELGGLNLFAMASNRPLNKVDLFGLRDKYPNAVVENMAILGALAALSASWQMNPQKPVVQPEYAGAICEKCCKDGTKRRFTTHLKQGSSMSSKTPNCPSGWKQVAMFHSHPGAVSGIDKDRPQVGRSEAPEYVAYQPHLSQPNQAHIFGFTGPATREDKNFPNDDQTSTLDFDPLDKNLPPISDAETATVPDGKECPT